MQGPLRYTEYLLSDVIERRQMLVRSGKCRITWLFDSLLCSISTYSADLQKVDNAGWTTLLAGVSLISSCHKN